MKMVAPLALHDQLGVLEQGKELGLLMAKSRGSPNVHSILVPKCSSTMKSIAGLAGEKLMHWQEGHSDQRKPSAGTPLQQSLL
uniref:Uncharacterized protein n=1 Tax=Arundo donax TaxID=35708 RepID=A0A0A9ETU4_ARUDO